MDALIAPDEVPAVTVREGHGPFVVVCEHAANRLPRALGTLGLAAADLDRHIAWDPGAVAVAEHLAETLGADLVVQNYSRLAVDCNRAPHLPDAVVERSEDTIIAGNVGLIESERSARVKLLWKPFHDALDSILDKRELARRRTALVTIHTFTPVYRGVERPWHVGIISTDDRRMADPILVALRRDRNLVVGDNEPYSPKDNVDYTIRRHGRERGLPHVMIEVRNDLVAGVDDQRRWAERLAQVLAGIGAGERAA
jgi:predicted N-formylglutamate amidohydrolase